MRKILILIFVLILSSAKFTAGQEQNPFGLGFPGILEKEKWSTQLLYDTVNACYQGTLRWIVITHPGLIGQAPTPWAQRQMLTHCFCVLDKIRHEHNNEQYKAKVLDQKWAGQLFMGKAIDCVSEYNTLPQFFAAEDNKTRADLDALKNNLNKLYNETSVPKDSQEESPDLKQKESEEVPETIFQG